MPVEEFNYLITCLKTKLPIFRMLKNSILTLKYDALYSGLPFLGTDRLIIPREWPYHIQPYKINLLTQLSHSLQYIDL